MTIENRKRDAKPVTREEMQEARKTLAQEGRLALIEVKREVARWVKLEIEATR
jgi:hypothetical protein